MRTFFVPKSFGKFGHYRADAVTEIAALPVVHAGHDTCETCQADVAEVKYKGNHAGVNCEACGITSFSGCKEVVKGLRKRGLFTTLAMLTHTVR
jgi:hypothetical protein